MGWNCRLVWGVVSAVGISGFASPGRAEEAGSESSNVLTEIVVTAQKREEKLQNVPIAITVVNAAQLANQHVYTIADLVRTTPALEMVQAFGGPGGGGQIRGIGTQSFTRAPATRPAAASRSAASSLRRFSYRSSRMQPRPKPATSPPPPSAR